MEQNKKRVSSKSLHNKGQEKPRKTVKTHTVRTVRKPIPTADEIAASLARQSRKKTTWTTFGLITCLSLGVVGMEVQRHRTDTVTDTSSIKPLVILSDEPAIDHRGIPTRSISKGHTDDSYQFRTLLEENRLQGDRIKNLMVELEQANLHLKDAQNEFVRSKVEPQNAKIVQMGRDLRKKELANQNLKKQLSRVEEELIGSKNAVKDMEMNLDGMMAVVDDITSNKEYNDLKEELQAQRTVYHEEMAVLERKKSKLQDQAHTLEKKLVEARAENDIMEQDVWHYEALLNSKEDEVIKIKEEWASAEATMQEEMLQLVASVEIEQTIVSDLKTQLKDVIAHQEYSFDEHLALVDERDSLQKLCTELSASHYELDVARDQLTREQNRSIALGEQLERALKDYGDRAQECEVLAKELNQAHNKIDTLAHYEEEIELFQLSQARLVAQVEDLSNALEHESIAKNKIRNQLKDVLAKRDIDGEFFLNMQQQLADSKTRAEKAESALFDRHGDLETVLEAYTLGATDEQIGTLTAALNKNHFLETEIDKVKEHEGEYSRLLAEREGEISELMKEALLAQDDYQLHLDAMMAQLEDEQSVNAQLKSEVETLIAARNDKQTRIHQLEKQIQSFSDDSETIQLELLAERADLVDQLESMQAKHQETARVVESLKEEMQGNIALKDFAEDNRTKAEDELQKTLEILAANESRVEELVQKLNYMGDKAADTLSNLRSKEAQVAELDGVIADITAQLTSKERELEETFAVNADLSVEINKLVDFKNLSMKKIEDLKQQTLAAEQLALESRSELAEAQEEFTAKQLSYQHAKEDLLTQLETLKVSIEQERDYRHAIVRQFDDLKACRNDESVFIREMEERTRRSEEAMELARAELKNKAEELILVKDKMLFEESKSQQLDEQLQLVKSDREQKQQRIEELEDEVLALSGNMSETQDMLVISNTELESLEKSYQEAQDELKYERDILKSKLARETHQSEKLQDSLRRLTDTKNEYAVVIEELQAFVTDLEIKGNIKQSELVAKLDQMEREYQERLNQEQDRTLDVTERLSEVLVRNEESTKLAESLRARLLEKEEELLVAYAEVDGLNQSCRVVEQNSSELEETLKTELQARKVEVRDLSNKLETQLVHNDRERNYIKELKTKLKQIEEDRVFEQCKLVASQEQVKIDLETDLFSARQHTHALTEQLEETQMQYAEAQRAVNTLKADLLAANEKMGHYHEELAQRETEMEGIQRSYGNAKEDLSTRNQELLAKLEEEADQAQKLEEVITSLQKDNSYLKVQCTDLEYELAEAERGYANAESEAAMKESELAVKYEEAMRELQQKAEIEAELNEKLYAAISSNGNNLDYIEQMSAELSETHSELEQTREILVATEDELENLHGRYRKANSSLNAKTEEQLAMLEQERANAEKLKLAIADLEEQNAVLVSRHSELEYLMSDTEAAMLERESELVKTYQNLENDQQQAYETERALREELAKNVQDQNSSFEKLEFTTSQLAVVEQELEKTRGELENLHSRYKKANRTLSDNNEALAARLNEQESLANTLGMKLEGVVAESEAEKQTLYHESQRTAEQMREQYQGVIAEQERNSVEIQKLQSMLDEAQREIYSTQVNLDETRSELEASNDSFQKRKDELIAEAKSRQNKINALEEKINSLMEQHEKDKEYAATLERQIIENRQEADKEKDVLLQELHEFEELMPSTEF